MSFGMTNTFASFMNSMNWVFKDFSNYYKNESTETYRKTAFKSRYDSLEFIVMLFSRTNAFAAFMDLMNWVLKDFPDTFDL